jgi:hypothetical protein
MTGAQKAAVTFWTASVVAACAWAGFGFSVWRGVQDWARGEVDWDGDDD